MAVYYNEIDPYAAEWLRTHIAFGNLPAGDVDTRSIVEVQASDLVGYDQCHFFAGIGGWPLALRYAGWPDNRPVWTGSCPCQPFSAAGKRQGFNDPRHLWPDFFRLIAKCKPPTVFGEQVASKDGRLWLAGIRLDLEILGYAVGAADLCSAGVGAPHIRQRLFWVADADGGLARDGYLQRGREHGQQPQNTGGPVRLGDAASARLQGEWSEYRPGGEGCGGLAGLAVQVGVQEWNGPTIAIKCSDGARRISTQPVSFPLAHGISNRVGRLRAYGNAINPHLAKEFIEAYGESLT